MRICLGRNYEKAILKQIETDKISHFVMVYGRRRVGKTFLIKNSFDYTFDFYVTGIANVNTQKQLINFYNALPNTFVEQQNIALPQHWFDAFNILKQYIQQIKAPKKKIFIDELPWMDTAKSDFIPALEHFWNSWAVDQKDIILIVCGSAAAWMVNKLINNKGGLHNRITTRIKVNPFTLHECELYFNSKHAAYDKYQLIQLYMALGGIPYYLEQVDISKSATQNINDLCFDINGILYNEFPRLYNSLFNKADKHIAIIEALALKTKGLNRNELLLTANIPNGGTATKILDELEQSNFIRSYNAFEKKGKDKLYQLTDFYSLFYIKFIKGYDPVDKNYWLHSIDNPVHRAWSGYAFEQVCMYHIHAIKKALGIEGIQSTTASWHGNVENNKAQIDLLIDRRDQVINIFEIKFSLNEYVIDAAYAKALRNKVTIFKTATKTKKAIFVSFITTHGLFNNTQAQALVNNQYTMEVLFAPQ